ncbi:MAG: hypothetical protein UX33_C0016G0003 [Candidatus Azambacteria bacterium GW2011_GWC1_46_13]|uniref:Uncharacterized protein n=1 Tax=Candidatus Azambacteria bacterium GW2011_GWC1_46_13 TaxID=1618619 RepID=A0A0G1NNT0_9BACT|nr:MAG: hypothetical protein UX33_C0016G0003 [Candidatus Azambacteria bacterium GW2011_GWC1_46_13]
MKKGGVCAYCRLFVTSLFLYHVYNLHEASGTVKGFMRFGGEFHEPAFNGV